MTSAFWGFVVVVVSVVFALVGQVLVQRSVSLQVRESHNTALGMIYAAVYVLYALALAFSLFIVWSGFREAQRATDDEADAVEDLYQLAKQYPEPERHRIQGLCRTYARVVAEEEWPLLGGDHEGRGSPHAQELADELVETVERFEPTTSTQQTLHGQGITLVQVLDDNRELRLMESHQGVPLILWVILVGGGVVTVSFGLLFGMKAPWLHRVSIASLTVLIVMILYTIHLIRVPVYQRRAGVACCLRIGIGSNGRRDEQLTAPSGCRTDRKSRQGRGASSLGGSRTAQNHVPPFSQFA